MEETGLGTNKGIVLVAALIIGVSIGVPAGVGSYTFTYARGASYFQNDPAACVNCHVMQNHLDGWYKSSHRNVATCNDCHAPAKLVPKYIVKGVNGWNHSVAFTTGTFPEVLRITSMNRSVTESACRNCHSTAISAIDSGHASPNSLSCIRCHRDVGHMH